jgi:hypothetical protein
MRPLRIASIAAAALLGLVLFACSSGGNKVAQILQPTAKPQTMVTAAAPTRAPAAVPTDTPAPVATATHEAVAPTLTPQLAATECAAGITDELRDISTRVDWAIYCPTLLPPGYAKELIGGPNPLEIRIVNSTTGSRIYFVQGTGMDLSSVTSLVRNEGELVGPIAYGDLEAQLFHSLPGGEHGPFVAVMADTGDDTIQYIEAYGPSEEDITSVAASMRRLDSLP